ALVAIAGLELELPLGTSQADGQHAQASADLDAAQARYEDRVSQIEAQVASLRTELEARREQIALVAQSADIAHDLAEAERGRLEIGTTTPLSVVQAQQTEREAELRRARAIVDRLVGLFSLEHLTGRLLERARAR
ncbi:MAG: TolC family protein, partial [Sandaracinaceae bacterium]|nr:TolC family protein [Sandaracinaceae bacterium]